MPTVPITPSVVAWAIEQSGFPLDELATALGVPVAKIQSWMKGTDEPNVGEARALAKKLRRPFAFLLWPEPPATLAPKVAFRAPVADAMRDLNPTERRFIRQASRVQTVLAQLRADSTLSVPVIASTAKTEAAAEVARGWLGIPVQEQIDWASEYVALREWRARFEERGVFVFSFALGDGACRGMTLANEHAPVIVVNSAFNHKARIYSLFHELAHVVTGTSSACAASFSSHAEDGNGLERWCEQFAAAALMPAASVRELLSAKGWSANTLDDLEYATAISRRYKVSIPAAALRLISLGHSTWKLWSKIPKGTDSKKKGGGVPEEPRTTPVVRLGEFGQSATRAIVDGVDRDLLDRSQAQSYLRVDASAFEEMEKRVRGLAIAGTSIE